MITNIKSTAPLTRMPYAQAQVITGTDDSKSLMSYTTLVAVLDKDGWLVINGLYSTTTRKHIRAFVREFVPYEMDFATIRYLAHNNVALNINTGELMDLPQ